MIMLRASKLNQHRNAINHWATRSRDETTEDTKERGGKDGPSIRLN
jgi:hypothetical protein